MIDHVLVCIEHRRPENLGDRVAPGFTKTWRLDPPQFHIMGRPSKARPSRAQEMRRMWRVFC
ncbi:hypothetical protein HNO88_001927 [Novosphingobium chloroacetimidivorans]|uniref:Uncharacterized protein n=1 Tax=Novosphingobium chloroacetimidivorans TaxID=1428314 RepID=A0A7W7K9V7_9SPHN|nr:hypothetical protein [Novosphingobium chloroacetimidivorans]